MELGLLTLAIFGFIISLSMSFFTLRRSSLTYQHVTYIDRHFDCPDGLDWAAQNRPPTTILVDGSAQPCLIPNLHSPAPNSRKLAHDTLLELIGKKDSRARP